MARTNLLFITTDQQRWDSLPCYGLEFIHTPNIDRLARDGTVFERCYTAAPLCVPCRGAWMSGQWPSTTGVMGNSDWFDDSSCWPARLGAAGYRTVAIGKMHFNPWDHPGGFRERIIAEDKRHTYLPDDHVQYLKAHGMERAHPTQNPGYFEWLAAPVTPLERRFHVDGFVGDRAAEWLETQGDEPFAAWVSFPGPHDPYDPPEELAAMYYDAPIPEPVGSAEELATKPRAQRGRNHGSVDNSMYRMDPSVATAEQIRRWRAHYYANITLIDEGVGKMLAALEEAGVLDDTLIVFTSDHGDALGDHGLTYKGFFYESMARVPLIVRGPAGPNGRDGPRAQPGARCPGLVSALDLVPLFYQVCRAPEPEGLQGHSILPMLTDGGVSIRDAVFSENGGRAMVCDGQWKYVHYESGEGELYDLAEDPDELVNRCGDEGSAEMVSQLRARLVEHSLANARCSSLAQRRPQFPLRVQMEEEYRRERERSSATTEA